ncbi:MAG: hypothetical protein QXS10_07085 [Candidatus Bathyarchaeia archaeon]|nr:hypothetical protein [Candidatus Bathyarchaeota archaeon]
MSAHKSLDLREISIYVLCAAIVFLAQYLLVALFTYELSISLIADLHVIVLFYLIPLTVTLIILLNIHYITRSLPTVRPSKKTWTSARSGAALYFISYYRVFENCFIAVSLFCLSLLIVLALLHPIFIHRFAVNLYLSNGLFRALVAQFRQITSAIVSALMGPSAFSFWKTFQPLIEQAMNIDPMWKYLLCQNIAAWSVSLISFTYVRYCLRSLKRS